MNARTLALGLVATLALVGCSEDVTSPETAPDLPPIATMQVDLALFDESNASRVAGGAHDNFFTAVGVAHLVHDTMVLAFTPPALAFAAAVSATPVKQDDESWLWSYSWSDSQGREVAIQLQAMHDALSNTIDWELRVSDNQADPPLENFVWFTGESNTAGTSGHWIFNDHDGTGANPREVVRVDWSVTDATHRSLTIALVDALDENVGDSITYAVDGAVRSMVVEDVSAQETSDITWDDQTGTGSIMWPEYMNGVRSCWDTLENGLVDVVCPEVAS